MSYIKHKTNLFLGVAELNRMQKFFEDDGYKTLFLKNSSAFGVFKYADDTNFDNFKVVEDVAGSGNFKIDNESFAVDIDGNIIRQDSISGQAVENNSIWYWVKVSYNTKTTEDGTVAIDSLGNLTGTDTSFLDVLRGEPNFPAVINFPDSSSNTLDYGIVEVLSDTSALLSGTDFTAETGLTYQVVGTFTPGHVASDDDKYPFQYDSCTIELVEEVTTETAPDKTDDYEFYIARVRNVGGTLTIQDKRTEIYKSNAEYNLSYILKEANVLVGVESSKYMNAGTSQDHNLVQVGFGMRTSGWSLDASNRTITFSSTDLEAGKYKTTSQFSDGELDGWRIYYTDGSYSEIVTSDISGTAIRCQVKEVDPSKLTVDDVLVVVPAVDSVELRSISDGGQGTVPNIEKTFSYQASEGFGVMDLAVPSSTYSYIIEYRYIKGGEATEWLQIPSDTDNGYYDEGSFDADGVLDIGSANRVTYTTSDTTGFITLTRSEDSYIDYVTSITTGDEFGYGSFELDLGDPIKSFTAGTDVFVQVCKGVSGGGTMTADQYIGISGDDAKEGNSFTFIFDTGIDRSVDDYNLYITSNYVSGTDTGTVIYTFTATDFDYPYQNNTSLIIKCYYNGSEWEAQVIQKDSAVLGDIKMISSIDLSNFTSSGLANLGTEHQGWALCNGNNGTLDLTGKFIAGSSYGEGVSQSGTVGDTDYDTIGDTGGDSSYALSSAQSGVGSHTHASGTYTVESHTHSVSSLSTSNPGNHTHGVPNNYFYTPSSVDSTPSEWGGHTNTSTYVQTTGAGGHTHTITGTLGSSAPDVTGSSASASADATEEFENRPLFMVLGFLQRVKQS